MTKIQKMILDMGRRAKAAALKLAACSASHKNAALIAMADALENQGKRILIENERDLALGRRARLSSAMLDRLKLDSGRIACMAQGVRNVAALKDPVGEILKDWTRPNGIRIQKVRVPLGVIGIIYESRPNVTADSACLCIKAGNACILRGGSEAFHSNTAIAAIMSEAARKSGLPVAVLQLVPTTDRAGVRAMAQLDRYLACIIPRGGEGLIRAVTKNATVPVIKHDKGLCHVFVDESADFNMAQKIVVNAKCQRPGVCNAMETLLIHRKIAPKFLPLIAAVLLERKVELRLDAAGKAIIKKTALSIPSFAKAMAGKQHSALLKSATEKDWHTEYLDLILSIRIVDSLDQAIEHINAYGSGLSDSILTRDETAAKRFLTEIDSATVYHNASTRFTDGGEFGMGAEVGISTDRLHARGPMALEELTIYKYVIRGNGQIRV